jgi:hypothetical protein
MAQPSPPFDRHGQRAGAPLRRMLHGSTAMRTASPFEQLMRQHAADHARREAELQRLIMEAGDA